MHLCLCKQYLLFVFGSSFIVSMESGKSYIIPPLQKIAPTLTNLPRDLKIMLLINLAHSADNSLPKSEQLKDAANNIRSLLLTSKSYAQFMADPVFTKQIITALMPVALKRSYFYNNKVDFASIEIAIALSTICARQWLFDYIKANRAAYAAGVHLLSWYIDGKKLATATKMAKLRMLFSAGIFFDEQLIFRETPLMRAIKTNDPQLVSFLLDYNPDVDHTNDLGQTIKQIIRFQKMKHAKSKDDQKLKNLKEIKRFIKEYKKLKNDEPKPSGSKKDWKNRIISLFKK